MTTQQVVIQLERAQPGLTLATPAPVTASALVAGESRQIPVQLTPGGSALELRPASSPAITAQIAAIAVGPRGPAGPQGPQGPSGVASIGGIDTNIQDIQQGDALVYLDGYWKNNNISDGGNF